MSPSAERSISRGDSADKEKTHDEQSRAAPKETVPEEMESMKAPPDMKTGRSLRTCLRGGLTICVRRIQKRGDARVQCKKEASEYGARSQLTAVRMTLRSRRRWSETDISAEHVKEK